MSVLDQTKTKMTAAMDHLKDELKSLRTGRANPSMLDHISVNIYETKMRIKDAASITCPEPRQLLITPFDPTTKGPIAKAIEVANLGFMPIVDGNVVRLMIPPMDEALRKQMCKECQKRAEEAKVGVRNIRRDANEAVRKQKKDGLIGEDEMNKFEKSIQEMTDKYCKEADEIARKKESEISTI